MVDDDTGSFTVDAPSNNGEISYLQLIPASSSSSLSPSPSPSTASPDDVMDSIGISSPECGGGGSSSAVLTVKTSGTNVKPKEVVLVSLAFLLLAFSS